MAVPSPARSMQKFRRAGQKFSVGVGTKRVFFPSKNKPGMASAVRRYGYIQEGSFSGSGSSVHSQVGNGQYQVRKLSGFNISPVQEPEKGTMYSNSNGLSLSGYAAAWAAKQNFDQQQINDIVCVVNLITQDNGKIHILSSDLNSGSELDRGSFGIICEGYHKGSKVAIKKISAVRPNRICCFLRVMSIVCCLEYNKQRIRL